MLEFDSVPPPSAVLDEPGQSHLYSFQEELTLGRVFTAREAHLVGKVRAICARGEGQWARDLGLALDRGFQGLGAIALALEAYPSMRQKDTLGHRERDLETLMQSVLEGGELGLEWTLPTKSVLSRSFGIAKVNFFQSLRYALEMADLDEAKSLVLLIAEALEEAVFTRMAEDLYMVFATSRMADRDVRRVAIEHLIDLWEGRVRFATYKFCPAIRSAWRARLRASRTFGTLLASSEIAQLLFEDCDEGFVERLCEGPGNGDDDEAVEWRQAFEEFLFDMPTESLNTVRERMADEGKECVDTTMVATYLGYGPGELERQIKEPRAMYRSFLRRRVYAQYRRTMRVAGPKRTAEGYVLEALLREELVRR